MNRRNLQKELDRIIETAEASGKRPKLLLHVCCAPCSSYCLEYLEQHFELGVLFANSNIDDPEEYAKRREELKRLLVDRDGGHEIRFTEGGYEPDRFHELAAGHEADPEGGERCGICFRMRLREAAEYAAAHGYEYFTTSLSVGPRKDAHRLCGIGEQAGEEFGVKYLPSDFKKRGGYRRSLELSRRYGLYRQNYCGCSFSKSAAEKDRERSKGGNET